MRAVVQRVLEASVSVEGAVVARIGRGLVAFVGVAPTDGSADADYVVGKLRDLRCFEDEAGRMNRSVVEIGGSILVVPQFTLYGDCRRGRRPSFDGAALPHVARARYEDLVSRLSRTGVPVESGRFQAEMRVAVVNDGPVTLLLDSARLF